MHDEWFPAGGDGEDGPTADVAPGSVPPSPGRQPHAAEVADLGQGEQSGVPIGAEGRTTEVGDGSPGEEESHRSAVDAVDGLLDEVERSLARLDDGSYGRCEECGTAIEDARLAESPVVRTCDSCGTGPGAELATAVAGPVDPSGTTDPVHD